MTFTPPPSLVHENVTRQFKRNANGHLCTKDLKDVFALLLLDLALGPGIPKKWTKTHDYTFTTEQAVGKMSNLSVEITLRHTRTVISFTIKPELATRLLQTFMSARLIHSPEDRTRSEPKAGGFLQPTPKGVAILQEFCLRMGIGGTETPLILYSPLNTMDLLTFERSSNSDMIMYLPYLVDLVFHRMMGETPNVWNPGKPADTVRVQKEPERFSLHDFEPVLSSANASPVRSPFAHRYFTNPDSDSHYQYYLGTSGLRLSTEGYEFTGKACWQWLMDCTDLMYEVEARALLNLVLECGLVAAGGRDTDKRNLESKTGRDFACLKSFFYELTPKGYEVCAWRGHPDRLRLRPLTLPHAQPSAKLELSVAVKDPGLRYHFKRYLETQYCGENLEAWLDLKRFAESYTKYVALTATPMLAPAQESHRLALKDTLNECLSLAYTIYATYITAGAPREVNLNSETIEGLGRILMHLMWRGPAREAPVGDANANPPTPKLSPALVEPLGATEGSLLRDISALLREVSALLKEAEERLFRLMAHDSFPRFMRQTFM